MRRNFAEQPAALARLALTLAVTGCGAGRTSTGTPGDATCAERLDTETAALGAAQGGARPTSRIVVELTVTPSRLSREIAAQVPVQLGGAKRQPIGVAGDVSYVVRRGTPLVALRGAKLGVDLPIFADVTLCKPVGPFCPTYGSCHPELAAHVELPLLLDERYGLGPVSVSVGIARTCVLMPVGVDATAELSRVANDQASGAARRVNAALPNLDAPVSTAWRFLGLPIALGVGTCLRVEPQRVLQSGPGSVDGSIRLRVGVTGTIRIEQPCLGSASSTGGSAPPPSLEQALPGDIDLEVPIVMAWDDVSAGLTRALSSAGAASAARVSRVRARAARVGGRDVVALDATLIGTQCGAVTLIAEPWYDATRSRVRLRDVRVAPGQPKRARALLGRGLEAAIAEHAEAALPVDLASAPGVIDAWLKAELPPDVPLVAEVDAPRVLRLLIDESGLVPIASVAARARIELR